MLIDLEEGKKVWGGDVWKRGEPQTVFNGCLQQEHFTGAWYFSSTDSGEENFSALDSLSLCLENVNLLF